MKTAVLAIGTELIMGQTVNTNGAELSRELTGMGLPVYYHLSVGDNPERVQRSLAFLYEQVDLIITTGGLGPTQDDLTREAIADYFGLPLELHGPSLGTIQGFFERIGQPMGENNRKQATFPRGAVILDNPLGTAPGFFLEKDGKKIAALPGPPREMRPMLEARLRPLIQNLSEGWFESRYVVLYGIGESAAETELEDLITTQTNPTIAPYAEPGQVMFRVTAKGADEAEAKALLEPTLAIIRQRMGDRIVSEDGRSLWQTVGALLIEKNRTLALAESCTGGMLAAGLTDLPGISAVFDRSYVTYSYNAKEQDLGVPRDVIESHGAVSEETARAMAVGLRSRTGADLCLSITGIAGPGGDTPDKPVGLVYIGLATAEGVTVVRNQFHGNRQRVRTATCQKALDMLRRTML